jgi:hypothetical protein
MESAYTTGTDEHPGPVLWAVDREHVDRIVHGFATYQWQGCRPSQSYCQM